jgi:Lhr-like helicase
MISEEAQKKVEAVVVGLRGLSAVSSVEVTPTTIGDNEVDVVVHTTNSTLIVSCSGVDDEARLLQGSFVFESVDFADVVSVVNSLAAGEWSVSTKGRFRKWENRVVSLRSTTYESDYIPSRRLQSED